MARPLCQAQPDHPADERLTELARTGDQAAFATIVQRYQTELLAHARRLVPDGRADDVVQQTFLNAWSALIAGAEVSHLRGWLHTIVRNAASRTQRPIEAQLPDEAAAGESLEELVQRRASIRATLSGLSALPMRQREALVSTALHGVPRARVASRMGLSEGAVRQLVHRARSTLRQAATAVLPYPLVRAFGRAGPDATGPATDAVVGAGAGSAGAVLVKLGAVVAAGALATGVSVHEISAGSGHHRPALPGRAVPAQAPARPAPEPQRRLLSADQPIGRGIAPASPSGPRLPADDERDGSRHTERGGDRDRGRAHHGDHGHSFGGRGDRGGDGDGAGGPGPGGPSGPGSTGDGSRGSAGADGEPGRPGSGVGGTPRSAPSQPDSGSPGGSGSSGGDGSSGPGSSGRGPSGGGSPGGGSSGGGPPAAAAPLAAAPLAAAPLGGGSSGGGSSGGGSSGGGGSSSGGGPGRPDHQPVSEPQSSGSGSGPGGGAGPGGGGQGASDSADGNPPGAVAAADADPDAPASDGGSGPAVSPTAEGTTPSSGSSGSSSSGSSGSSESSGSGSSGSSGRSDPSD